MTFEATKPAYRDRYACRSCGTGYLDCAAGWTLNLKCCADCDGHPGRWSAIPAYTAAEIQDMRTAGGRGETAALTPTEEQ